MDCLHLFGGKEYGYPRRIKGIDQVQLLVGNAYFFFRGFGADLEDFIIILFSP
jgi:hypothetical protein